MLIAKSLIKPSNNIAWWCCAINNVLLIYSFLSMTQHH